MATTENNGKWFFWQFRSRLELTASEASCRESNLAKKGAQTDLRLKIPIKRKIAVKFVLIKSQTGKLVDHA